MATACYTPNYLPASFKGVPCHAEEASSEHGRRGAEGEFPFGERSAYQDLGRKIRTYRLRARFQENNHIAQAAVFIAACESRGPGILVHPTRGVIINAACRRVQVTDKVENEQGVTYVDVEFVEANNWTAGLNLLAQILGGFGASSTISNARNLFVEDYEITTVSNFRREDVRGVVRQQVGNISAEYQAATSDQLSSVSRNRIVYDLSTLQVNNALTDDTETVDKALALGMAAVGEQLTGVDKFRAFRRIANGAAAQSAFAGNAGRIENAIYRTVRVISAAYMIEAALEAQGQNSNEILEQISVIETLLAQEIASARQNCQNQLEIDLRRLSTEAANEIYRKAYTAPGLVNFNFSGQASILTAAYEIYGDATRHRDLENLNVLGRYGSVVGPTVQASQV